MGAAMRMTRSIRRYARAIPVVALLTGLTATVGSTAQEAVATVKAVPLSSGHVAATSRVAPLPTSQCLAIIGIHCYNPLQFQKAYNLQPLYDHGLNGKGRTIVIV